MATINGDEYTLVMNDRQDLKQKLEAASGNSDFLYTHYTRMLRACELSYQQAVKSNIVLERKDLRKTVKAKREAFMAEQRKNKGLD
jgi:hypothetical protein